MKILLVLLFAIDFWWCHAIYLTNTSIVDLAKVSENPAVWTEEGLFGPMLEDWALSNKRDKRVLQISISENLNETQYNSSRTDKESKINNGKITNMNNMNNIPNKNKPTSMKQISETDLYLLGAIEKLVYKVDFMEKRLRRVEEMLYYVMAGNRIDQDPCPDNFTRVGGNCYMFAYAAGREYDWKVASKQCKKLGAALAEFETIEENQDVVTHIQATQHLRGKDFWTGGLNPGLLWIWSNSARPVNNGGANSNKNGTSNILGDGRCLKLAYNPALRSYAYRGSDCSIRNNYICEQPETSSSNQISRIGKSMNVISDDTS